MLGAVRQGEVEHVAVRGLHRAIEADSVHRAGEARDDLPANRLDDAEPGEDAQLHGDRRTAAAGSFGARALRPA